MLSKNYYKHQILYLDQKKKGKKIHIMLKKTFPMYCMGYRLVDFNLHCFYARLCFLLWIWFYTLTS